MSVRVYPIRFTRKSWHIGLYCVHECTRSCNYILVRQKRSSKYTLTRINNEDDDTGRDSSECSRKENIENTIISINNFDIRSPRGMFGPLYEPDKIVIPKKEFYMSLDFPMSNKIKVFVNDPLGDGFMLKEILYAIKIAYEDIYNIEEQTSTQNQYVIMTNCDDCFQIDLKKCIKQNNAIEPDKLGPNNEQCPICQDKLYTDPIVSAVMPSQDQTVTAMDTDEEDQHNDQRNDQHNDNVIQLNSCTHRFHKHCMQSWINNDGKTCPICRQHLYECKTCNGNGNIVLYYEGVVPPVNYRGTMPRIQTDGIYGIFDFYLEDLYVNALKYDKEKNELIVSVQT